MATFLERTEGKAIYFKSDHQLNSDEYDYQEIDMEDQEESKDWDESEKQRLHDELNRIFPRNGNR